VVRITHASWRFLQYLPSPGVEEHLFQDRVCLGRKHKGETLFFFALVAP